MNNLDKYYMILGLQRGATQEEIQSAFRQMAKLYHPDQDSSTYAQMQYHEARQAYDALRNATAAQTAGTQQGAHANGFTGASAESEKKSTTNGAGGFVYGSGDNGDLLGMYGEPRKIKERIPFSLLEIPVILRESIEEIASIGMLFRVILYALCMMFVIGSGVVISGTVIFCSLVVFAFFRYYFFGVHIGEYSAHFWGSLLYSIGTSYLVHVFNPVDAFNMIDTRGVVTFVLAVISPIPLPVWIYGLILMAGIVFLALYILWV